MNIPYDGRNLDHPELGIAIKLWDFTGDNPDNLDSGSRWVIEHENNKFSIFDLNFNKQTSLISPTIEGWNPYLMLRSPIMLIHHNKYDDSDWDPRKRFLDIAKET